MCVCCEGCGGAIYGYHGYQVYFFCVGVCVMGTTGTKYVVYRCVGDRFMGTTGTNYTSSVCVFFVVATTGTKDVLYVFVCGGVIYGYHGYQV